MTYLDEEDEKCAWGLFGRERGEIHMEQFSVFGSLLRVAWPVSTSQALASQAESMQVACVWLVGANEPG